ncbi:MAG: O-antigen ligase family protein [Mariprofundaceae bacterium]|nr:O-antigen ligase family protein [Mariprofundaceae bacterium]
MMLKKKSSWMKSPWLVLIAPLLAFTFMLNVRIFPFIAPNEEPKWAVLTLCALCMALAAAWLCWKRNTALSFSRPSIPALLLIAYTLILAIGIFIGPNTTEGMIRFSFWFFCLAIWWLAVWAVRHEKSWLNALTWAVSIGSFIFSIRYWESYMLDFDKPNYNIHVLFSPIGHVNFTGDVLIILLPMLLWVLASKTNPILRVLSLFSASTVITVLLVASSRGALGGLLLAGVVLFILAAKHYPTWRDSPHKKQWYLPALLISTAFISSFITYSNLDFQYRDLARLSATAGQAASGTGKVSLTPGALQPPLVNMWVELSPLLGARTSIFASTTAMTLEQPLLGQGTGNFAWVYPNFSNRYPDFRDSLSSARTFTTNPHNVALQIASQNGIPAMFIFLGLLLYFWYRLVRSVWQQWDAWLVAGSAALTAVIFDAMFNHVFFNPASMFVFALLAGSWWGALEYKKQPDISLHGKIAAPLLVITVILLSIWPARWLTSEWNAGHAMAFAQQPQQEAKFYQQAYAWDQENFRAVFGMGQIAYKQQRYAESARYFSEFEAFYPYNPPALNMLGAALMMNQQYQEAAQALQRALIIYPDFDMAAQNLQRIQAILQQQQRFLPTKPQ